MVKTFSRPFPTVFIPSDMVGHLLSIGMNQVVLVLLSVVGGADSLCRNASVDAI